MSATLQAPLVFTPRYQELVWGGRRMAPFRADLPPGRIGESWDLADHDRGMSVVAVGTHQGKTLRALCFEHGPDLVGDRFAGGSFPLMVKLIDAADRLSVQVHPDDALARALGVGDNGKTECWLLVGAGGELFQGTRAGVDRESFARALSDGSVESLLHRFACNTGDFFFLDARTVHALGAGCLLFEVQQTSDVTFRAWDWGRVGLDGKPRPLHVRESLDTIDFSRTGFGPQRSETLPHSGGGRHRRLAACAYFEVEERIVPAGSFTRESTVAGDRRCSIISVFSGAGTIECAGGSTTGAAMQTVLIPAAAGGFTVRALGDECRFLHARPRFAPQPGDPS